MKTPAVFFDRDGTINIDPGYLGDPELVKLFPNVPQSISKLRNIFGFKIVVVSNQSGVSRGLISADDVEKVNLKINELLKPEDALIDAFYFCPYHPQFSPIEKCSCRKPSPEMILTAADDLNIDLSKSYMVGDKASDIISGFNAGVKTVLISTSKNDEQIIILQKEDKRPNFVAENFSSACNFICNDFSGGKT
ncbi:MAG: HAD family hydrolase [Ignavibacteriae bacterium]|jgi:D,D-heptose 1,7-bisphosphate phosphatase|nr:HAD family hydrolase [Ignavibacteriota bacterium]NOG99129.1 HAD family hydrolase [Ignavibacteriota bacterium]